MYDTNMYRRVAVSVVLCGVMVLGCQRESELNDQPLAAGYEESSVTDDMAGETDGNEPAAEQQVQLDSEPSDLNLEPGVSEPASAEKVEDDPSAEPVASM